MIKDLLVQSRFRNAILWDLMAGRSVSEMSREVGCTPTEFGRLLNLKRPPITTNRRHVGYRFTVPAQKIADHFKMLPEDLFPASLYALTLPDRVERTFESETVLLTLQCAEARQLPDATDLTLAVFSEELKQ